MTVALGNRGLDRVSVIRVARGGESVELNDELRATVDRARSIVERLSKRNTPVYGVSTGFGSLAGVRIEEHRRRELQESLVRSHASGVGPRLEEEVVRAMVLLRARTLGMGYSGARIEVVQALVDLLNAGLTPVVPEHGSVGASGDLAPLAHVARCLLGEGDLIDGAGRIVDAAEALHAAGIRPLALREKEGLSLVNGTDGMLGMLVMACTDVEHLLAMADVAAAMSIEALLGTDAPFHSSVHAARPHPGQLASAANLWMLLQGSEIVASHRASDHLVQDAYSLRCAPQVLGAARDTLTHVTSVVDIELRSAIDNPMICDDGISSNGNFHGAPLAFAADFLSIAVAEIGSIAERRVDRLLDPLRSNGLPAFLAPEPGVQSGLMIAQYTAAAMVAENRRLASPASVDSIPTSGMQEDHVSMGWGAARKLRNAIANCRRILAIEVLCATHGLEFRGPLRPSPAADSVLQIVREVVPSPGRDRSLSSDIDAISDLLTAGHLRDAVEQAVASSLT